MNRRADAKIDVFSLADEKVRGDTGIVIARRIRTQDNLCALGEILAQWANVLVHVAIEQIMHVKDALNCGFILGNNKSIDTGE